MKYQKSQKDSDLLGATGAARLLNYSVETIRRLERVGKLKATKADNGFRLFKRSDLESFLASRAAKNEKS